MKLAERIAQSLRLAASSNSQTSAAAAAVLWPDKDGHWQAALPQLAAYLPSLMVLGNFDPGRKTGPAIWLKCAVAGALPDISLGGQVPVICMPGVSRADLRAIEDCPRELQPLAELQYRGAYWSQANTKDWSPNAFLTSNEWRPGSRRVPGPCDAGGVDQEHFRPAFSWSARSRTCKVTRSMRPGWIHFWRRIQPETSWRG